MTPRIRTADAEAALRSLIESEVLAASGGNTLISRAEGRTLSAYVHRVELTLRAEGGPGTRVPIDRLIDRAIGDALAVWARFNPPDQPRDHLWLARDELVRIGRADPELGEITARAIALVSQPAVPDAAPTPDTPPSADTLAATRAAFEALDLARSPDPPGASRVDARPGQPGRAGVPAAVAAAFDYYLRVEDADLGSARLVRMDRSGWWAILTTTDGDEATLELLDDAGATVDGARFYGGRLVAWDEFPRRVRLCCFLTRLGGYAREEGYSELDERAAMGQPPRRWTGDALVSDGEMVPAGSLLGPVNFGSATLSDTQRELAIAALDHLWDLMFRVRMQGETSLQFGLRREGVLAVGNFTRPTDGVTYETAAWQDIDDGSFVLYYIRGAQGLSLAIEQFDN